MGWAGGSTAAPEIPCQQCRSCSPPDPHRPPRIAYMSEATSWVTSGRDQGIAEEPVGPVHQMDLHRHGARCFGGLSGQSAARCHPSLGRMATWTRTGSELKVVVGAIARHGEPVGARPERAHRLSVLCQVQFEKRVVSLQRVERFRSRTLRQACGPGPTPLVPCTRRWCRRRRAPPAELLGGPSAR